MPLLNTHESQEIRWTVLEDYYEKDDHQIRTYLGAPRIGVPQIDGWALKKVVKGTAWYVRDAAHSLSPR